MAPGRHLEEALLWPRFFGEKCRRDDNIPCLRAWSPEICGVASVLAALERAGMKPECAALRREGRYGNPGVIFTPRAAGTRKARHRVATHLAVIAGTTP